MLKNLIQEVHNHLESGDIDLGFRRLMDITLDTQDLNAYKSAIQLADNRYDEKITDQNFIDQAQEHLNLIESIGVREVQSSNKTILKAENLIKKFGVSGFQLGPVDLELNMGEVMGLVGENGNGKTTLLRLLGQDLAKDTGKLTYSFDSSLDAYDQRAKLVFIPQRLNKMRGPLLHNLYYMLGTYGMLGKEAELRAHVMLARMGLWPYKHLEWSRLSSGYKMRFELVFVLLQKFEILLLDEPLANLDILAQEVILQDLKYMSKSLTNPFGVVLSSQQLYEVEKVSDKIIYLERGEMKGELDQEKVQDDLVIEFEGAASKEEYLAYFTNYGLKELKFNGGTYVAYFPESKSFNQVLSEMGSSDLSVNAVRDISQSSRRFFVR